MVTLWDFTLIPSYLGKLPSCGVRDNFEGT